MNALRIRVVEVNEKYRIQVYDSITGFKQIIKNYGPYKTINGAFIGAKKFIQFFNYSLEQLDTEVSNH